MAWTDMKQERVRCPHCREMIDLRLESRVKVAVWEPFRFAEGAQLPGGAPTKGE